MLLTNTNNVSKTLKILLFGSSGAGKTYLARTIKEPLLIISAEAGLLSLQGTNFDVIDLAVAGAVVVPKEKRIQRLNEVFRFLQEPTTIKKYKWIYIDSLTEITQLFLDEILTRESIEQKRVIQTPQLQHYGELNYRLRQIVKAFRDLPFYNIVFTATSEIDKDDSGARFEGPQLIGKLGAQMPQLFDEVLYLYVNEKNDRKILTQKTARIMAKDRSGKLDQVEEPNLFKIGSKILGVKENETKSN